MYTANVGISEAVEDNLDPPYEFVKQAVIGMAEKRAGRFEPYNLG